jgi:catechol 2,3-dioxygenase-like lactoylglutathione lyase family enzyme
MVQRMDHVGIVVDDLAAATEFFVALGLDLGGEGSVEGGSVDRIPALLRARSRGDHRRAGREDRAGAT